MIQYRCYRYGFRAGAIIRNCTRNRVTLQASLKTTGAMMLAEENYVFLMDGLQKSSLSYC
jgi:hypothetical protein